MELVLVGLDHKTAPLALREQFYLANDALQTAFKNLRDIRLEEVAILSTCNRLEILAVAEDAVNDLHMIVDFLGTSQNIPAHDLIPFLYTLRGRNVAQHLMRVASGLESQLLGETQILGQVSNALAEAQEANTSGPFLSRLFTAALHTGKRVRTETAISRHTLSLSHAAVLLIQQQIELTPAIHFLVVGAGQMAELAIKALQSHNVENIQLINRTDSKAKSLAKELGVQALAWDNLSLALRESDVVIAATGASNPVIRTEHLPPVKQDQNDHLLLLVDIGLPRNIAPDVRDISGVHLYDIDDLHNMVDEHRILRQSEIVNVEAIISQELEAFMDWLHTREVAPLITELRLHAESLAQMEVEQALNRLPGINPHEQEIITQMAHRIVNKLLHAPTVNLKSRVGHDDHYDYAHAVRELFALDDHKAPEQK